MRPTLMLFQGRQDRVKYVDTTKTERLKAATEHVKQLVDARLYILHRHNVTEEKMHSIVVGEGVQARWKDTRYPYQSRENVLILNNLTQEILKENSRYENITFLDVYNFTLESPGVFVQNSQHMPSSKTSDGFHYWAGVNIGKANAIARLMSLLVEQKV